MIRIRNLSLVLAILFFCAMYTPSTYAAADDVKDSDSGTPVILTGFDEPDRADAVAFAVGTSQANLAEWFDDEVGGFTGYDAQGNSYSLNTDAWFLKDVNPGIPGVYYAYATPDLSDGYVLGEGVTLPKQLCAVSIQTPGNPDINCCVSGRGFLHFPWVLSQNQQEQLEQFTVRLRKDGGAWTQLSTGFYITSDDLQLSQRIFKYGSTYDLKVSYPGGQTGTLTLRYDDELSIVDYSGGDRDGGDVSGGGQSTGTQPAPTSSSVSSAPEPVAVPASGGKLDSSKPATQNHGTSQGQSSSKAAEHSQDNNQPVEGTASPETPSGPVPAEPTVFPKPHPEQEQTVGSAPEPKPVIKKQGMSQKQYGSNAAKRSQNGADSQTETDSVPKNVTPTIRESYSPTQTVISGLRMHDLCANEKNVVLGEGSLTVSIPSKLLLALNLEDTDTLSVKLMQPEKDQVTLEVNVSGKAVTELPGAVLRLRYTPKSANAGITVWNKTEKRTTNAEFDGEFLRFSADAAGTYTILETAAVSENSKVAQGGMSPLLPLMGGGLFLAVGTVMLIRRKRHG